MKIEYIIIADNNKILVDERGGKSTKMYIDNEEDLKTIKEVEQ